MMLYFDTSFLVPLFLPEATSAKVQSFFSRDRTHSFAISHWTRVEFASTLAREVRMGALDATAAEKADDEFEDIVAESFEVFMPVLDDFDLSKRHLRQFGTGLRTGDAMHLAIATRIQAKAFYSFDKKLAKIARQFGLGVNVGI